MLIYAFLEPHGSYVVCIFGEENVTVNDTMNKEYDKR